MKGQSHPRVPRHIPAPAEVLSVEDNAANVRLVGQLLRRLPGVEPLTATDGSAGFELAVRRQPGLILLDLHLPDLSGEEVLLDIPAFLAVVTDLLAAKA